MQRRGDGVGGRKEPGKRTVVTLEDVARAAGVHYSTVSRALDPQTAAQVSAATRKRVQAVAKRMGYRKDMVASGLKRGRTHTVAVVVADLGNPFIAPVLRGIANCLEAAGLMSLVGETQDDSARLQRIIEHLLSRRVDAIILTAAHLGDRALLRRLKRQGVPVVLALRNVPGTGLPAFTNDEAMGGSLAARHLLALGHRRLAQLRGPADIYSIIERAEGFSTVVASAGGAEVTLPHATETAPTAEEGSRMMHRLLDRKRLRPTAVFAHNDLMALGALSALSERGLRCPADMSVIGYHDLPQLDRVMPPLTTIRQPQEELGRTAAESLVAMLDTPRRMPPSRRLAPLLVVRRSTGPPPDAP
jgi:LacI family transcriptional regulator